MMEIVNNKYIYKDVSLKKNLFIASSIQGQRPYLLFQNIYNVGPRKTRFITI